MEKGMKGKVKRNERMVTNYKSGKTLAEIGDVYGISKQRVQQILKCRGIGYKDGGQQGHL